MKYHDLRQYECGWALVAFKEANHNVGRTKRTWLAAKFAFFYLLGPDRRRTVLLTSPFIEQITRITRMNVWAAALCAA